jgi:flagellar hook assembly protein FlgD
VETFSCIVVNRWGVTVAQFDDIQDDWDGKDKSGSSCPDGVYFYTYEGTSFNVHANGQKIKFQGQGNVTIVASP